MAELTAEVVRTIVKEEISVLRTDMDRGFAGVKQEFSNVRSDMKSEFANVRSEMKIESANVRSEMLDGTDQILESVQRLNDDDCDEISGIISRLRNHNARIAKLERLSNLR